MWNRKRFLLLFDGKQLLLMTAKKAVPAWVIGEFIGTFILVFFGCGSVCAAVTTGAQVGIFQVAIIWGLGIAIAIHLTAALSGAHLNPAVTISFAAWSDFPKRLVPGYIITQIMGAFGAAALLHVIFGGAIVEFESKNGIVRGQPGSEASAMIYGEFYPNPQGRPLSEGHADRMSPVRAFIAETVGTALLLLVILATTDEGNKHRPQILTAAMIGLTVTMLISLLGPLTMACFNPARDFGPRLFSTFAGWGTVPFAVNGMGWLTVYIIAPIVGGLLGGGIYRVGLRPYYESGRE